MKIHSVRSYRTQSFQSKIGILVPLHRLQNGNILCWRVGSYDVLRINKQTKVSSPRPSPPIPERVDKIANERIADDGVATGKTKKKKKRRSLWPCVINSTKFASYKHYLSSNIWAAKRGVFADRYEKRCGYCENTCARPNLHHLSYARLGNERDTDLVWLCEACHHNVHATKFTGPLKRFSK